VLVLAIDSAAGACSAAVWDAAGADRAAGLRAYRALDPHRGQADRLIALVEAVLDEAGLAYADLGTIAVSHGPGSFTGLRTAVAAARGLALATGLGVIPVSSLEALAGGVESGPGEVFALLDARRGEVFAQGFGADRARLQGALGEPRALPPQDVAAEILQRAVSGTGPIRLAGSGAALVQAWLPAEAEVVIDAVEVDARLIASVAARCLQAGEQPVAGFAVRPLYLRPPDARPPPALMARRESSGTAHRLAS